MSPMIQALERRMLMSVTADTLTTDLHNVQADAAAATSARVALSRAIAADVLAIAVDLQHADTSANRGENNVLLAGLRKDANFFGAKIIYAVNGMNAAARYSVVAGTPYGKALLNHPTSAAYQKYVAKVVTYANGVVPEWVTYLQNEVGSLANAVETDLGLIGSLNSSLSTAVSTVQSDLGTKGDALGTVSNQVQTDITQFTSDLGAIPT